MVTITVDKDKFGAVLSLASLGIVVLSQDDASVIETVALDTMELVQSSFDEPIKCSNYINTLAQAAKLNTKIIEIHSICQTVNPNKDNVS